MSNNNDLYKSLGFKKTVSTKKTNGKLSLEGEIKKGIKNAVHSFLLEEYPHLYKQLEKTTIIKTDKKDDTKVADVGDVEGYHLLIPIGTDREIKNNGNKVTLTNAVKVSNPQIYLQGVKNNVCEFVKEGGKVLRWDNDKNQFTS